MQDKAQVGAKRSHPGGRKQKWFLDERGRQLIMDLYDGTTERITLLEKELRVPRKVVKRWAGDLGVARQRKDILWSDEDIAYLQSNYHKKSLSELSKHLRRPNSAIKHQAFRLRLSIRERCTEYTGFDLKEAFGCKYERIQMWIERGWLKGKKRAGIWQFTAKDIRRFIAMHPNELDQRHIDWLWVVDILAGGEGIGRLDESYERGEE